MKLTIEELREWVAISNESPSGLVWIKSPRGGQLIGHPVGGISVRKDSNYYIFGLKYQVYYVHRVVYCMYHNLKLDSKVKIDHVDGNQLNNSIHNLRITTNSGNSANTSKCKPPKSSKYKGVSYYTRLNRWVSVIRKDGRSTRIGVFDNEVEAAMAYNKRALEVFGEFARINEIGDVGEMD